MKYPTIIAINIQRLWYQFAAVLVLLSCLGVAEFAAFQVAGSKHTMPRNVRKKYG